MLQLALILAIIAGFLIGHILPHFTREEMQPGKKYFKKLEIALALFIFLFSPHYSFLVIFALSLFLSFSQRMILVYLCLIAFLIYQPSSVIAGLGFLYGLPAGTLYKIST